MKRKHVMTILSIIAVGAVALKIAKKKKSESLKVTDNSEVLDIYDEAIASEYEEENEELQREKEKDLALEKILSDVEDMYRDREEIVPPKPSVEEVPAPENKKKKFGGIKKAALIVPIMAMLLGSTRGYCDTAEISVQDVYADSEASELKEEIVLQKEAAEPEDTDVVSKEEYEDIPELIAKSDEETEEDIMEDLPNSSKEYSEEDVFLLAQLIVNESGNQEREGQIGVAEVVLNRLNSNKYPDTVSEVIYQAGQFSNNEAIKDRKPSEEIIEIADEVLNGDLRVLNNADVLYFRNPMITSGISPEEEVDWGRCKYFCNIGDHAFYLKADFKAENADEKTLRLRIIDTAFAYGEKVKNYTFGGKPNGSGDDNTNMNLDCSGYVSWVLGEALNVDVSPEFMGSANVNNAFGLTEIEKAELNIGDIGYRYEPGTITPVNHCGIYIGNGEWIHCNSKDNGVSVEETEMFAHYYSVV